MESPRKSSFNQAAQSLYESSLRYMREQRYFRSRGLWLFGIFTALLAVLFPPRTPLTAEGVGEWLGTAIGLTLRWVIIPYLIFVLLETLIRRTSLSPKERLLAFILAGVVALIVSLILIATTPAYFRS